MELFTVTIEELVSEDFTVEAETQEKAIEKAISLYKQGSIVLCPGNLEMKRVGLSKDDTEWVEF